MLQKYETIDLSTWERRELYEHFTKLRMPHYEVAAMIDVTPLVEYTRRQQISFYLGMIYLATQSVNHIKNFRYRIVEGKVVLYEQILPNFTHKKKDEDLFRYHTTNLTGSIDEFARTTAAAIDKQQTLFGGLEHTPNLVYYSCLPWLETTAITNPGMENPDDAITRINWGKYTEREGRKMLNVMVTANHRFIDGYHIALFINDLQERINLLADR